MSWRVFGGRHADLYLALLKERLCRDELPTDPETVARQFRLHLHRGISYLAAGRTVAETGDLIAAAVAGRNPDAVSPGASVAGPDFKASVA